MKRTMLAIAVSVVALAFVSGCSSLPLLQGQGGTLPPVVAKEGAAPASKSVGHKVLLYLPNRVLDIVDMISLNAAVPTFPKHWLAGFVHVNAHVTRVVQVGAGNTNENIIVGLGHKRQFLPWFEEKYELSGGPLTFAKHKISRGNRKTDFGKTGVFFPGDEPFANGLMDYWGVGAEVTVLPVGVRAEVHPVEIVDALLGFFTIDIVNDDL